MNFSLECEQEVDGRWIAEVPELPGILSYGALLPMPCQRPKCWLFALLPTGLKMTSLSLLISAYRSQPQHECLALSQTKKIGPRMLSRIAKNTALQPSDL